MDFCLAQFYPFLNLTDDEFAMIKNLHNNPVKSQLVFGASGSKAELALLESPVEGIEDRAQLTLTVNPSMKRNADTHRAL